MLLAKFWMCIFYAIVTLTFFVGHPPMLHALEYVESIQLINQNSKLLIAKAEMQKFYDQMYLSRKELQNINPLMMTSVNALDEVYVARLSFAENIYDSGQRKLQARQSLLYKNLFQTVSLEVEQNLYIQSIGLFLEILKNKKLRSLYRDTLEKMNQLTSHKKKSLQAGLAGNDEILECEIAIEKFKYLLDHTEVKLESLARRLRFLMLKKDIDADHLEDPTNYIQSSFEKLKNILTENNFKKIQSRQIKLKELRINRDIGEIEHDMEISKLSPKLNLSLGINAYDDRLNRKNDKIVLDYFVYLSLDFPIGASDAKEHLRSAKKVLRNYHNRKIKSEGERIVFSIKERIGKIEAYQTKIRHIEKSNNDYNTILHDLEKLVFFGTARSSDYIQAYDKKIFNEEQMITNEISQLARKAELLSSPTLNAENEDLDKRIYFESNIGNEDVGGFYDKNISVD